jgi:hypothetical protein
MPHRGELGSSDRRAVGGREVDLLGGELGTSLPMVWAQAAITPAKIGVTARNKPAVAINMSKVFASWLFSLIEAGEADENKDP